MLRVFCVFLTLTRKLSTTVILHFSDLSSLKYNVSDNMIWCCFLLKHKTYIILRSSRPPKANLQYFLFQGIKISWTKVSSRSNFTHTQSRSIVESTHICTDFFLLSSCWAVIHYRQHPSIPIYIIFNIEMLVKEILVRLRKKKEKKKATIDD